MKRFLTTGFLGAILGIVIGGAPADASLISRGFLDEVLTSYATTTALDLKANQSDFTDLNTEISDSVDVLRRLLEQNSNSYEFVNGINPEKFPNTISGAFNLLYQYLDDGLAGSILHGWTDSNGTSYAGFVGLNNGWTDSEKKTYLGVKGLNDKIGDLPTYIPTINMANYEVEPIEVSELKVKDYFDIIRALLDGSGLESADASKVIPPYVYIAQQAVKIGTVPDGYETVGAALTAMDAKIDARELPSSSADGQYVLSAKKVGDTITYTWVKMDLTSEEQAQ